MLINAFPGKQINNEGAKLAKRIQPLFIPTFAVIKCYDTHY